MTYRMAGDLKTRGISGSVFSALFRSAYRRIWESRWMKIWEAVFWSIAAVYLASILYGYNFRKVDHYVVETAWLVIVLLPPLMISVWVYRAHVSLGISDASLKTIPQVTSLVFVPRMAAVAATLVQFIAPFLLVFFTLLDTVFVPAFVRGHGPNVALSITALVGWYSMPIMWGFLVGSRMFRSGGPFLLAYFVPVILGVFYLGELGPHPHIYQHQTALAGTLGAILRTNDMLWPFWMQSAGIIEIFAFPFVYILACREWERPEQ